MSRINSNVQSLIGQRLFLSNSRQLNQSLERLSTARRINSGKDDPAGLITSENLKSVLAVLEGEASILRRADSVLSTVDGKLGEMSDLLIEAESLAVANASDFLSAEEKAANQLQIDSILSTVDRLASSSRFNGDPLLDGTLEVNAGGGSLTVDEVSTSSIGAVEIDGESYTLADVSNGALNTVTGNVSGAVEALAAARQDISRMRGEVGAFQRHTIASGQNSISLAIENISAANSRIADADFAAETANLSRLQLLNNASLLSMSIANSNPQNVLFLLG